MRTVRHPPICPDCGDLQQIFQLILAAQAAAMVDSSPVDHSPGFHIIPQTGYASGLLLHLTRNVYLAILSSSVKKSLKDRLEVRAGVLKALAHPSRLLMVHELSDGERCVCELQSSIGTDMSTVSKHLSVLKHAGIVESDKRGLQVYYRLTCSCITSFLDCLEELTTERKHIA